MTPPLFCSLTRCPKLVVFRPWVVPSLVLTVFICTGSNPTKVPKVQQRTPLCFPKRLLRKVLSRPDIGSDIVGIFARHRIRVQKRISCRPVQIPWSGQKRPSQAILRGFFGTPARSTQPGRPKARPTERPVPLLGQTRGSSRLEMNRLVPGRTIPSGLSNPATNRRQPEVQSETCDFVEVSPTCLYSSNVVVVAPLR